MFNILILSKQGEGYGLIDRIKKEGHIAKLWIENPSVREVYQTLLHEGQAINRYEECLESADLVISASVGFGGVCDRVRKDGRLALGGGIQDLLITDELMRESASRLLNPIVPGNFVVGVYNEGWKGVFEGRVERSLLEGDRGPLTEGMGCVVIPALDTLELHHILNSYTGLIGILSTNVGKQFFNPIATCIFPAMMECIKGSVTDYLMQLAKNGKVSYHPERVGLSSRVGYLEPMDELKLSPEAEKHFWRHYEPGSFGYFSSSGETIREARRRVLRSIEKNVPRECVYRRDIGDTSWR